MKTSKLLLAMVLLGVPCWQGCLTALMWKNCYEEETSVSGAVRADVEGLYEQAPRHPGGKPRLVLHCRLADPVAAEASEVSPFEGAEGCIGIEAARDEVGALARELEETLARHCYSVDSVEGELLMSAGAGGDDGAELVLLLHADTGEGLHCETFRLRGRWYPVDRADGADRRQLLLSPPYPFRFQLVRCEVDSNAWLLALLTPLTVSVDVITVFACLLSGDVPTYCYTQ